MEQADQLLTPHRGITARIRSLARRRLPARLLAWGLLLAAATTALALRPPEILLEQSGLLAVSAAAQVLASIAIFSYSLVRFGERHEVRWIATAAAFSMIGIAAAMRFAVGNLDLSVGHGAFAQILATLGVIGLAWAGISRGRLSRSTTHMLLLPVAGAAATVFIFRHQIGATLVVFGYTTWAGNLSLATSMFGACILVAVCHSQRYIANGDRLAGLLAYWGVTVAVATAAAWLEPVFPTRLFLQAEALSSFAALLLIAGLGVENGMAQREANERFEDLECLHTVSWFMVGTGSLQSLLTAFAQALSEHLEAEFVAVYLAEQDNSTLTMYAFYGLAEREKWLGQSYSLQPQPRRGFHSGHTARALASKEIQVVKDIYSDVEFVPWQTVAARDGYVVSVPLIEGNRAIGVVNLYFDSTRPHNDTLIRLLQTVAASAAPAVKNAYLAEMDESLPRLKVA
jgi:hypothetical protein